MCIKCMETPNETAPEMMMRFCQSLHACNSCVFFVQLLGQMPSYAPVNTDGSWAEEAAMPLEGRLHMDMTLCMHSPTTVVPCRACMHLCAAACTCLMEHLFPSTMATLRMNIHSH